MKKQLSFIVFMVALAALLSLSVFAAGQSVEADSADDISTAVSEARTGDTVTLKLVKDIELSSSISIAKGITLTLDFNGYQLSYTGASGMNTTVAGIVVCHEDAIVNLKGSNPLADYASYSHYGSDVKPDMKGNSGSNLTYVSAGTLNIESMYMYAQDAFVIYGGFVSGANYEVNVNGSVLRVPEAASNSAITFRGGNNYSQDVKKRILTLKDSVEYGGFFGLDYNFNVLAGTKFTNVKFYDFYIKNDCWYDPNNEATKSLLMNKVEAALPVTGCVFNTYGGELGSIKIYTETGKQNLRLFNCEFSEFVAGDKFSGDRGGSACVFIITKEPTCVEAGVMDYYEAPQGGSATFYEDKSVPTGGHSLGEESAVYENGYANNGVGMATCTLCGESEKTETVYNPIFESLGYSLSADLTSVTQGIKLNVEMLEQLPAYGEQSFDFGLLVGKENACLSVTDNTVTATNGYAISLKKYMGTQFFDVKVVGFDDTNKDKAFVADFYVYDGEQITYVKENYKEASKLTYNGIIDMLDEVKQEAEALLESKHKLYYNDDGSFRVMILADLHVRSTSDTTEIEARIKKFVDENSPNLIILTGDNTIGAGTEESLKTCLDKIVGYIEEKQIPWCHVYGNHDREGALSNEAQQAVYESYEYCISKDVDGISGVGNYVHGIYNKDGTLGSVIYFLDTGTSNSTYSYDYIQPDQIAWYEETSELLQEYNGGSVVKGMMAFHIPLLENQYAYDNRNNTEIVYEYDGERYEPICPSTYDTSLLETILVRKDIQAIVTGHDHNNTYMYNYYGVKLCSAPTISSLGYSNSVAHEGVRIFDLDLSKIDDIETYIEYVIERIDADDYDDLGSNITLESFEGDAPTTGTASLGGGSISGTLSLGVAEGVGVDGSKAMEVKRSQTSNSELYIYLDGESYGKLGANKYLVVWMDLTNVEFRKACTGLLTDGGVTPYMTDNDDNTRPPYYYLADGSHEWVTLAHGGDGCFGTGDGGGINGKKGYFAFAVEDYLKGGASISEESLVTGYYMYLDIKDSSYANVPFYIDNIMLVEDYTTVK